MDLDEAEAMEVLDNAEDWARRHAAGLHMRVLLAEYDRRGAALADAQHVRVAVPDRARARGGARPGRGRGGVMDLDEAERRLRHWVKTTDVLPWYFANELERHFAEYDRRGAALADAQAEVARLRAADEQRSLLAATVVELAERIARLRAAVIEQADEVARQTHVVVSEGQREALEGIARELRALASAPAPAEDGEADHA